MRSIFSALLVISTLWTVSFAHAELGGYELITPEQNTNVSEGKVEVLEFFWYGCPHCNQLEPTIEQWNKESRADYIEFVQVAAPLNPSWTNHSKAFYAAQIMGVLDKFHAAMFTALHQDRKQLNKLEDIADFAAEQGIDRDKFLSTMKSFAVQTKILRANQLARAIGITGVPAMAVNGKFKTSVSLAGGQTQMMDVVDELAKEENQQ